jgi:hydroxyquinol 1,2-dioxygenase
MSHLVAHPHGFVRDAAPSFEEFQAALRFLTTTGYVSDQRRQEFILLANVLGVSMLMRNTLAGAQIDVWQSDAEGFYDLQRPERRGSALRARLRSNPVGRFWFRSIVPAAYPIPDDGPVGALLRAAKRHPWRPAHVHFMIAAPAF